MAWPVAHPELARRPQQPAVAPSTPHAESPKILALAFPSHALASQALQAAFALQREREVVVHDAILIGGERGNAEVVASMDPLVVAAAVPGALVGAFIGTLLAGPIGMMVGGSLGGASAVLAAKLADTGIPYRIVEDLRATSEPGQYVLALLASDVHPGALTAFAVRCGTIGRSRIMPCE